MTFVLILSMFAGWASKGDSVALVKIEGFKSKESCIAAGNETGILVKGTLKDVKFICLEVK